MPLGFSLGVLLITTLLLPARCSGIGDSPVAALTPTGSPTPSPVPTPTTDDFGENGTPEVNHIDVGRGSSTLLVGPTNETMLIDSGDWQADGEAVIDYLQRENVTRIDYLVTSHTDADHIGGHAAVIEYLETEGDGVGAVYDPGIAASIQTYDEYLDAVSPSAVVISSDDDSRYGHPHNETLKRFAARDVTTFWTGIHGPIMFVSDVSDIALFSQTGATTDPLALRSAPAYSAGAGGEMVLHGVIEVSRPTESTATTDGGAPTPGTDYERPASDGSLTIAEIHADAEGDDRGNLNDEYVVFTNAGDSTLDLTGWTVTDEVGHRYTFPDGYSLAAGESVTLHSGMGTDVPSDLYWGAYRPVWNNDGDTIIVTDAGGERVLEETY